MIYLNKFGNNTISIPTKEKDSIDNIILTSLATGDMYRIKITDSSTDNKSYILENIRVENLLDGEYTLSLNKDNINIAQYSLIINYNNYIDIDNNIYSIN